MGKKSKIKQMRRIASQLPVFNIAVGKYEKVSGVYVLAAGIKEVNGKPVDELQEYKRVFKAPQPVNHSRNMKRIYNEKGLKAVQSYINAVDAYAKQEMAKATPTYSYPDISHSNTSTTP